MMLHWSMMRWHSGEYPCFYHVPRRLRRCMGLGQGSPETRKHNQRQRKRRRWIWLRSQTTPLQLVAFVPRKTSISYVQFGTWQARALSQFKEEKDLSLYLATESFYKSFFLNLVITTHFFYINFYNISNIFQMCVKYM